VWTWAESPSLQLEDSKRWMRRKKEKNQQIQKNAAKNNRKSVLTGATRKRDARDGHRDGGDVLLHV
jgi:hypothetical protein